MFVKSADPADGFAQCLKHDGIDARCDPAQGFLANPEFSRLHDVPIKSRSVIYERRIAARAHLVYDRRDFAQ
jgi:hypothetical protein